MLASAPLHINSLCWAHSCCSVKKLQRAVRFAADRPRRRARPMAHCVPTRILETPSLARRCPIPTLAEIPTRAVFFGDAPFLCEPRVNRLSSAVFAQLTDPEVNAIEADILFYKRLLVWHMVDRADRFHNGEEIENKTPPVLMRAIHSCLIVITV